MLQVGSLLRIAVDTSAATDVNDVIHIVASDGTGERVVTPKDTGPSGHPTVACSCTATARVFA
jgi:hypothetical protein